MTSQQHNCSLPPFTPQFQGIRFSCIPLPPWQLLFSLLSLCLLLNLKACFLDQQYLH